MPLTRADVQMLHGVLRQMVRWKDAARLTCSATGARA